MSILIGISGPCHTGKSTLMNLLKTQTPHNSNVVFIPDLHDSVWDDLVCRCKFNSFDEIYSDREYLLLYCSHLVKEYDSLVKRYEKSKDLVVFFDGSYLDLWVYMQLHLWYHYPSTEVQEKIVCQLLSSKSSMDRIYMTRSDDERYPIKYNSSTLRQRMVNFKRNRHLELLTYDIYRDFKNVQSLSSDVLVGESEIMEDLKNSGIL